VIVSDQNTGVVTVVPTGYMEDVVAESFSDASDAVDAYQKNGFSDYEMISPNEIEALMASTDLLTKTGTFISLDYWTNQVNIAETEAKAWIGDDLQVKDVEVSVAILYIPVRRVTVV